MLNDLFKIKLLDNSFSIGLDMEKKVFRFSALLLATSEPMPRSVHSYIEKRQGHSFKPHATTFHLKDARHVELIQEVPICLTVRRQVIAFWHLVQTCRTMLRELAQEALTM